MPAREATAFLLLPLIVAGIWFLPPWVYLSAVWVIALLAAWELLAIIRRLEPTVQGLPALVAIGLALVAVWVGGLGHAGSVLAAIVLLLPTAYLLSRGPTAGASGAITGATFTAVYFAVAAGAMGLLRLAFPDPIGPRVVLLHCFAIWAGDSGAYYLGSRFGKHKLAPNVSPKKSWEGILGGTVGTFFGVWFCRTVFFAQLDWDVAWLVAAALSVLAPVGDLVESLFKRDAGVKDSSGLIPGHGGFLDRTDSLFFAAPFVLAILLVAGTW
jgi:phosphatidate cytidylyltransferase